MSRGYIDFDTSRVLWDAAGKPYWQERNGPRRDYIPPVVAGQYRNDPKLLQWAQSQGVNVQNPSGNVPGGGFLHGRGQWDSEGGRYKQPINYGNLASLAIGGAMAAPVVASALGGAAASGGAAGATTGATAGTLPGVSGATLGTLQGAAVPSFTGYGGSNVGLFSSLGHFLNSAGGQLAVDAGSRIAGGVMQNRANGQASDAQLQASREALALLEKQYQQQRADEERIRLERRTDTQPYRDAGYATLNTLGQLRNQSPAGIGMNDVRGWIQGMPVRLSQLGGR